MIVSYHEERGIVRTMDTETHTSKGRAPTFAEAAVISAVCAAVISCGVLKLGCDAHIPIVFSAIIAALYGSFALKHP